MMLINLIIAATSMAMAKVRAKDASANRENFSNKGDSCKRLDKKPLLPSNYTDTSGRRLEDRRL